MIETNDEDGITGTCLPIYGLNEGDSCSDDSDCENGLRCMPNLIDPSLATVSGVPTSMFTSSRTLDRLDFSNQQQTCQPPGQEMLKKQYSKCDSNAIYMILYTK
ncbi:hypothetical protein QR98_0032050 [Sarcoptes scabiei]|uniref:Uncharacterized protein n=1 Tax=Sarcoptes scabiei TaxID=52283 RepID=A0A132A1E6_SARSC|nr:hypothetical protein QR98_0032050 [Sarcoptes scabiei]